MVFGASILLIRKMMEMTERSKGDWYRELYRLANSLYPVLNEELFERKVKRIAQHLETDPAGLKGYLSEEEYHYYEPIRDATGQLVECFKEKGKECINEYVYLVFVSLQNKPPRINIPAL